MQKSDLHHLFPTDSKMNSSRGSLNFGDVVQEVEPLKCSLGKLGHQKENNQIVFEAPMNQRGNTARAIFYFAMRYQMKISPAEEAALRTWANQDPVDQREVSQNDAIEQLQGNRNPFVDFPDMLDHIQTFNVTYAGKESQDP
jgi:endonuclease I